MQESFHVQILDVNNDNRISSQAYELSFYMMETKKKTQKLIATFVNGVYKKIRKRISH